jgi:UDP:flavonoid glycosyltransferase YjiC (YdhE family)
VNVVRVLFVAIPERGHMNPLIAVAQRLERAGHEVAFFAHGDIASMLAAAGLAARLSTLPDARPAQRKGALRHGDVVWLARWFEIGIANVLRDAMLDATARAIDEFRPDVMAIDPLAYHGVVVADARAIPWAGLSLIFAAPGPDDWTSTAKDAYARMAPARDALFAKHGIRHAVRFNEVLSPWLRVAFTTEALLGPPRHGFFLVGPAFVALGSAGDPPFPWERLAGDRPIVYVAPGAGESIGMDGWGNVVAKVASAMPPEAAQIVAALPRATRGDAVLPDAVLAVGFAPQRALLERVDAVVTAGGVNTVSESLAAGRPMLVVPFVNDQPLQGVLVERAGVGFCVAPPDLDDATCRDRLGRILDQAGAPRVRARALAESYRNADGAGRAAELVVELGRSRRPMRSDEP